MSRPPLPPWPPKPTPCLECIVVDDCSADGSGEAIAPLLAAQDAPRFQLIRHPENRGQMAAMLSGLDATTAPFVAWLDADDVWLPEYIERHMAHHLNAQVNAAISTSNMAVIDAEGTLIVGAAPPMSVRSPLRGKGDRSFPIRPASCITARRSTSTCRSCRGPCSAVEAVRPLRCEGLRTCADHYLARFAHAVGGTIWIGETLGCYRIHGGNGLAKRTVHGDGPLGKEPSHIAEEGNYQFAMKLRESDLLAALMADGDLKGLLARIGRGRRALWTISLKQAAAARHAARRPSPAPQAMAGRAADPQVATPKPAASASPAPGDSARDSARQNLRISPTSRPWMSTWSGPKMRVS